MKNIKLAITLAGFLMLGFCGAGYYDTSRQVSELKRVTDSLHNVIQLNKTYTDSIETEMYNFQIESGRNKIILDRVQSIDVDVYTRATKNLE
jgi:hypothetical protein